MTSLFRFTEAIDKLSNGVGRFGSWLILPLIFVIIFDVLTRKFQFIQQAILNSFLHDYISPTKLQELEWHLHAAIFLLAFGMTYLHNAHVRVDVLRETFSRRKQAIVELIGLLVFALPYFAVVTYYGWEFVSRAFVSGEGSDALTGLPHRWVIKSFLLAGLIVMLLSCLSALIKICLYLFGSPEQSKAAVDRLSIFPVQVEEHADMPGDAPDEAAELVHDPEFPDENRPMT